MKHVLVLIILIHSMVLTAQQWEPMGSGIEFVGWSFAGVKEIKINYQTEQLYVGGYFDFDGNKNKIWGFTKWDKIQNSWDTTLVNTSTGCTTIDFFNNKLYVTGGFSYPYPGPNSSRLYMNLNNNNWQYIENGPLETIFNSRIIDDKIYYVGSFDEVDDQSTYGIAIFDGENFENIPVESPSLSFRLDDIIKYQDEIYVVGKNMITDNWAGLAKIQDGTIMAVHNEFLTTFGQLWVYSLAVYQDNLYIGGNFYKEVGYSGNGIQYYNGTDMFDVGGGVNGSIYSMKVYKGELYVVGGFTRIGMDVVHGTSEGQPCSGVAKWDGEEWTCLFDGEFDLQYWFGVKALEIYNDTLYIGGNWTEMDGDTTMSCIARRKITPKPGIITLDNFSLYPNPTNNQLHFDFGDLLDIDAFVTIYNPIGQLVKEITISAWQQTYILDTSPLSKGVYFVKVQLEEAIQTKKIIIQ